MFVVSFCYHQPNKKNIEIKSIFNDELVDIYVSQVIFQVLVFYIKRRPSCHSYMHKLHFPSWDVDCFA